MPPVRHGCACVWDKGRHDVFPHFANGGSLVGINRLNAPAINFAKRGGGGGGCENVAGVVAAHVTAPRRVSGS